jgi:formylglycine-generating enzyme required for sulfatase activity
LPTGLRLAGGGNSWYAENCGPYAKEAGIQGHKFFRTIHQHAQRAPGDTRQKPVELAEKGDIDAFVWGHTDGLGGAAKMLLDVLEAGMKKNPNFKVYVQVPWLVHDGRNPAPDDIDYGDSDLADVQAKLDKRRKAEEAAADKINARFGKRVVVLVPMSDAMMELRRMIAAGKFPGVKKHSAVFAGDHMPHASALGAGLGELCHFATIYRMSPEGLPKTAAMNRLGGLHDNQVKILQKLAWDTVSKYPYSGVAKVNSRPAGLRVIFNGNSWFNFVPAGVSDLVKSAGIEGHEQVKVPKPNDLSLFEKGQVDVYAHGVHWWTEPINEAEKIVAPALKANPNFRAYYHAAWLVNDGRHLFPDGRKDDIKVKDDYDASNIVDVQTALDKTRKSVEAKADALNKKFGKPVVFIVPVGDAVTKLRAMVIDGKYPGVKKQSELFTDTMPHPGAHIMALSGYCHFAAIYRMSPAGLQMPRFKEIKPEQHAILQKLAWETVSRYPYAGVVEPPPANVPKQGDEIRNSLGMRLAYVPPGKFMMGSPENEPGRESQERQHEVELTKGFYLGAHEVTVGQFRQFVRDAKYQTDGERDGKGGWGVNESGSIEMKGKYSWKSPGFEQTDDHPVVLVNWDDAQTFCRWLCKREKLEYRLPTEAEWEYACRADTAAAYAFGNDATAMQVFANALDGQNGSKTIDGYRFTAPVGQFKRNAFGLYDMHGNVWEWCADWYDLQGYAANAQVNPTGQAKGIARVQRGGGWSSAMHRLRSAARVGRDPSAYRGCYLGFRVVLETP